MPSRHSAPRTGAVDDNHDKTVIRVAELERANKIVHQPNDTLEQMVKKHEPEFDFKALSTRSIVKTAKTSKTSKPAKTSPTASAKAIGRRHHSRREAA